MSGSITAAFPSRAAAEQAVEALVSAGVDRSRIDVRIGELEDQVGPPSATVTGAHRVALICAVIAGVVSAVLAVLMVQGVVPIRGFEFLGTSVVGAALRGLGAGVGVGALFGYILGMGMWDDDGEPESPIVMGETVVAVSGAADGGGEARTLRDAGGRLV